MCGINGLSWSDESVVGAMNRESEHRGPDDSGIFVDSAVSLGHVRLSILDLSERGHQPMATTDQSLQIVYNGEIYNFLEIRAELEAAGQKFVSDSDTEVILYAYQHFGVDAFAKFNGIFAFCIYDQKTQQLLLVRDRLGIKPLFYAVSELGLAFSSEVKAFSQVPGLTLSRASEREWDYFLSHNVTHESFVNPVLSQTAGSYQVYDLRSRTLESHRYCDIALRVDAKAYNRAKVHGEAKLIDELDELLNTVVKDQMVSDAPLGTIGSGGLDSSLVSAIAAQYKPDLKIFHVSVADDRCDESAYARQVSEHLQLELVEAVLDEQSYLAHLDRCIEAEDLPLTHPNSVGIYLISEKAKDQGFSVLLTGEGADELFGGYHRYRAFQKRLWLDRLPLLPKIIGRLADLYLEDSLGGYRQDDLAAFEQYAKRFGFFQARTASNQRFAKAYEFITSLDQRRLKTFISSDMDYYLPPILRRTDRMSMAAGLEMRVPFLDNRLVDFCLNLPVEQQVSAREKKHLLKKVGERYLPRDIVYRAKKGFPLPIDEWLEADDFKQAMFDRWNALANANA